jgi:PIN domain
MSRIILLPDTNIFLHFPALAELDWCNISGAETVVVMIAPVVMRELNDHKDNPRSRKLRDRADAALKELHARFKGQKPKELRPNVEVQFLTKDPAIDFADRGLLKELSDDWLIATAIDLSASANPDDTIAIVSADFGLEIKASPHVKVIGMHDSLRLPEEINAEEKKIKELERQLRLIHAASPDLKLAFVDGAVFQELRLFEYPVQNISVTARLEEARNKYPKQKEKPSSNVLGIGVSQLSNSLMQAYNHGVDTYLEELERFWNTVGDAVRWYNSTAKLQLYVRNEGGAPADDIDVFVHFPDGFEVVSEKGLPRLPKEPSPPQSIEDSFKRFTDPVSLYQPSVAHLNSLIPKPEANSRLLDIKKTKSHDVKFHVKRLKHHGDSLLPDIYLHFSDEPKSFRAEYRIIAGNVPAPREGSLDFVWKRRGSNT